MSVPVSSRNVSVAGESAAMTASTDATLLSTKSSAYLSRRGTRVRGGT